MDRYKITQESWNKQAQAYQDKFMDLEIYDHTYDAFCSRLPQHAQILEIGCGPGNITRYLLNKRSGLDIMAIDTSPEMIRLAKENNPTARFMVMDCRYLDQLDTLFNGIICGFCLPYLSREDVQKLVADSAALLHPGGVLYLSMIEDKYSGSGLETSSAGHAMQVYYHEESYITAYLTRAGFEDIDYWRIDYPKADGSIQVHLVIMAVQHADPR